jgi:DNA-binding beta-propeller fold protein YncE
MDDRIISLEPGRPGQGVLRATHVAAVSLLAWGACGDDPGVPGVDAGPGATCVAAPLPLQNARAFPLGETFYLPVLDASACPPAAAWRLSSAPGDSTTAIHLTGAPAPRFTPDVAGDYVFEVPGVNGSEVRLTVVAYSPAERFRNHYLTPLYGAAHVGDEIWVANGASYTVTRVAQRGDAWVKRGEVTVGSWPAAVAWREPLPYGVVALRGSDTIGFIDRERGVLVDALWVGDEPTGLAISLDAATLYVSLATMREIAVVDLPSRAVVTRIAVGFDPRALAISPDGARLFAASYRSGNPDKDILGSYAGEPLADDIWVIDTAARAVVETITGVSADLRAIALAADGSELYVAATNGDPILSQADPAAVSFIHEVIVIGAAPGRGDYGQAVRRADLTRQPSSAGPAVNPAGVAITGNTLWVAAESSSVVVMLDRATLAEAGRVEVGPGPRQILPLAGGGVAVHCYQAFELWILDPGGQVVDIMALTGDPRPAGVALGERVFTRPGGEFAFNNACTSCHVEAQNDGMVWNFGADLWSNIRPLQLLDATTPLGWDNYVSSTENFAYQGPGSTMGRPVAHDEASALGAFLGSLIGAPRANSHTRLDGSYTEAALRGQALFTGKAGCATCHVPPLYTSRVLIEQGKSGLPAGVPSLLGVYRHGVYFVKAQARSLEDALDVALAYVGVDLTSAERADLLAFLQQLTPKGSAPLGMWPDLGADQAIPSDARPYVAFADPVDTSAGDAAAIASSHVVLEDAGGEVVPASIEIASEAGVHRIVLQPDAPLVPGATYRFRVRAGLPFLSGGALEHERASTFTVAEPASATLPDTLLLTATLPGPQGPVVLPLLLRRQDGRTFTIEPQVFGMQQRQQVWLTLDRDRFLMEPFALPVSPRGAAGDARDITGTVTETDAAGQVARIEGTMNMLAPGRSVPAIPFAIVPAAPE